MKTGVTLTGIVVSSTMFLGCVGDSSGGPTTTNPLLDVGAQQERRIDGRDNNLNQPEMGSADSQLIRLVAPDYEDGMNQPAGADRPSTREISNTLSAQRESILNSGNATDFLWQWGQFFDHDIDLTGAVVPQETMDISVPMGDPDFDPARTGEMVIPFDRSLYDHRSGDSPDNPRQQVNMITAFVDASNVYGSDSERAAALRTLDGSGRMRMSEGDLLPFNTAGFPNAGGSRPDFYLAGDVRANEQIGLTALHTLFVREHNRLADELVIERPDLSGEEIYQRAKAVVAALIQVVTYREVLPLLLGDGALEPYRGYRPDIDPGIANVFATASYRFGHSMVSETLMRLNDDGSEFATGHLAVRDAFFSPHQMMGAEGLESLLRGLAAQPAQEIDLQVVDELRNFLFGDPGEGGMDLVALNIQRGRDHGLPDFNSVRIAYGLDPVESYDEVSSDLRVRTALELLYATPDDIDAWVGCLAEDHLDGAMVGELTWTVLVDQFQRLRDGDRFWYENTFSPGAIAELEATRLSDIIRRNTSIGDELPGDVFVQG